MVSNPQFLFVESFNAYPQSTLSFCLWSFGCVPGIPTGINCRWGQNGPTGKNVHCASYQDNGLDNAAGEWCKLLCLFSDESIPCFRGSFLAPISLLTIDVSFAQYYYSGCSPPGDGPAYSCDRIDNPMSQSSLARCWCAAMVKLLTHVFWKFTVCTDCKPCKDQEC